jgi:hypothetical protein
MAADGLEAAVTCITSSRVHTLRRRPLVHTLAQLSVATLSSISLHLSRHWPHGAFVLIRPIMAADALWLVPTLTKSSSVHTARLVPPGENVGDASMATAGQPPVGIVPPRTHFIVKHTSFDVQLMMHEMQPACTPVGMLPALR